MSEAAFLLLEGNILDKYNGLTYQIHNSYEII